MTSAIALSPSQLTIVGKERVEFRILLAWNPHVFHGDEVCLHRCARLLWLVRHDRLEDPAVLARRLG
jgi:hypothetical protein